MRMSMSPQKGGFHKCTGGGPFCFVAAWTEAITLSAVGLTIICPLMLFAICARQDSLV
jgi:hypothetical protein